MTPKKYGRLYLFLARRDRTQVKILAILQGEPRSGRVTDLTTLDLPPEVCGPVSACIRENRMHWEPWVEAAETFQDFLRAMRGKRFSGLPMGGQPLATYLPGQAMNSQPVRHRRTMLRPHG